MQGAEVLTKFTADTSQVDKATKDLTGSFGGLTKAITLGNIASQAFSKTIQAISSNLDSAISRTDIMNNFPKVMKNLGIEAKDAEKSIAIMSEKLIGLPTMLDEGAMAVQRFTSANGDVAKSTDIFLAVNNAILAGGANAQTQATALEQLSQAYAKGKPDMMEWRTLMTAMPAQLKQVALAMGYVNAADLGEAVREKGGEAEFQRMIETIQRLNVEGENGFASLEEQARGATGGIATSVKNMKNAFVRGVADIITKVDEALAKYGGISGVLSTIGKTGEKVFSTLGTGIAFVIPYLSQIFTWLVQNKEIIGAIMTPLVAFIATFKTIGAVIGIINGVKTAFMALSVVMSANPIGVVVGLIVALIATIALLWNKCDAFRNFWINLWNGIKATFLVVITNIQLGIDKIKNAFSKLKDWISNIWKSIKNVFSNMGTNMSNIGSNIAKGLWNGLKSMKDWVINKVKDMGKSILNGLKKVLGISSPSREFAIVGKYSAEGYVEGLDGMQKEIDKTVNATFNPFTNSSLGAMTMPSPTNNITIHNSMKTDALGQLVNDVKTFSGGAKNDYNYVGGY